MRLRKRLKGCAQKLAPEPDPGVPFTEVVLGLVDSVQGDRAPYPHDDEQPQYLPDQLLAYTLRLLAAEEEVAVVATHRLVCRRWRWLCDDPSVLAATVMSWENWHSIMPGILNESVQKSLCGWSETFPPVPDDGEEDMDEAYSLAMRVTVPLQRWSKQVQKVCTSSEMVRMPRPLATAMLRVLKLQDHASGSTKPQQALAELAKDHARLNLDERVRRMTEGIADEVLSLFRLSWYKRKQGKKKGKRKMVLSELRLKAKWLKVGCWLPSTAADDCLTAIKDLEMGRPTALKPVVQWIRSICQISLHVNQTRRSILKQRILMQRWETHRLAMLAWVYDRVEGALARHVEADHLKCEEEAAKVAQAKAIKEAAAQHQRELKNKPAEQMQEAMEGFRRLDRKSVQELMALKMPPTSLFKAMQAVRVAVAPEVPVDSAPPGDEEEEQRVRGGEWRECLRMALDVNFMQTLLDVMHAFSAEPCAEGPARLVNYLDETNFLLDPTTQPDRCQKSSECGYRLCMWLRAVHACYQAEVFAAAPEWAKEARAAQLRRLTTAEATLDHVRLQAAELREELRRQKMARASADRAPSQEEMRKRNVAWTVADALAERPRQVLRATLHGCGVFSDESDSSTSEEE